MVTNLSKLTEVSEKRDKYMEVMVTHLSKLTEVSEKRDKYMELTYLN